MDHNNSPVIGYVCYELLRISMNKFEINKRNKVVRVANRGAYDRESIYEVLDDGFLCHVSFIVDGQPFIIPTIYGREGDSLYLHGSVKSRMVNAIKEQLPISIAVTHVDGIVLARSAFHHSANYRSAVLFGTAMELVNSREKNEAFKVITEQVLRGRWAETRQPTEKEIKVTSVLKFNIESASAKVRTGGPVDDKEDYDLDIWAGVLPYKKGFDDPIQDELLREGIELSDSVKFAGRVATS